MLLSLKTVAIVIFFQSSVGRLLKNPIKDSKSLQITLTVYFIMYILLVTYRTLFCLKNCFILCGTDSTKW